MRGSQGLQYPATGEDLAALPIALPAVPVSHVHALGPVRDLQNESICSIADAAPVFSGATLLRITSSTSITLNPAGTKEVNGFLQIRFPPWSFHSSLLICFCKAFTLHVHPDAAALNKWLAGKQREGSSGQQRKGIGGSQP